jgi:hypothetical protein
MGTFTNAVIEDGPDVLASAGREVGIGGGAGTAGPPPQLNAGAYTYGGTPGGADAAVNKAWTGDEVYGVGGGIMGQREADAANFANRQAQMGDYAAQNQAIGELRGIEAQQGPSAAQAQLQAGNNAAIMAQQLALARSGRGFGGGAGSAGLAQSNLAGLGASNANAAAQLRAQEDAAWRGRQAQNLTTAAGMFGQQAGQDLQAYYQNQGQNDAAQLQAMGLGQQAYFQGADARARGYDQAMAGTGLSLQGQALGDQIRQNQLQAQQVGDDNLIRMWAAQNGYDLAQQQAQDQKTAAYVGAGSSLLGSYIGAGR